MAIKANSTSAALSALAEALAVMTGKPTPSDQKGSGSQEGGSESKDKGKGKSDSDDESDANPESGKDTSKGKPTEKPAPLPEKIAEIIRRDDPPDDDEWKPGNPPRIEGEIAGYSAPIKTYDRVARADTLLKEMEDTCNLRSSQTYNTTTPDALRSELDELMQDSSLVSRLATKMMRLIMAQQTRAWQFDQEDGHLDSARLARVISSPALPAAYKTETIGRFKETTITLLLDNSGSMSGDKINATAVIADTLARVFERCNVPCEILGFTTHGNPMTIPGVTHMTTKRCDPLLHIVYKEANQPYRRTRENYGLMLSDNLLHNNVDGEALVWAYNRLVSRPQPRRIMIVISDGSPSSHTADRALAGHLRHVINQIQTRGDVELLAIGIHHDVTDWYKRSICVNDIESVGPVLMTELSKMFEPKRR